MFSVILLELIELGQAGESGGTFAASIASSLGWLFIKGVAILMSSCRIFPNSWQFKRYITLPKIAGFVQATCPCFLLFFFFFNHHPLVPDWNTVCRLLWKPWYRQSWKASPSRKPVCYVVIQWVSKHSIYMMVLTVMAGVYNKQGTDGLACMVCVPMLDRW